MVLRPGSLCAWVRKLDSGADEAGDEGMKTCLVDT